jgi:hypothetical protein
MAYRLYKDDHWIAFWSERPAIWEIESVVKDRDIAEALYKRKRIKDSGVLYRIINKPIGEEL